MKRENSERTVEGVETIFLAHTHSLPSGIRPCVCGAVFAVELDPKRCELYFGSRPSAMTIDGFLSAWPNLAQGFQLADGFRWAFSLEGVGGALKSISDLALLRKQGLCILQPCHWLPYEPFANENGLSQYGRDLLRSMQDNEMILDVSHMSGRLLEQTLSEYNGAVIASHVVCSEALKLGTPRANSLNRSELEYLCSRQALIGLPFVNDLLAFAGATPDGCYSAGIEDLVRQICVLIDIVGVEHLAMGGDFFDFRHYSRRLGLQLGPVAELDTVNGISSLQRELASHGLSVEQIRAIFRLNALAFLKPWLTECVPQPYPLSPVREPAIEIQGTRWTFQDPCDFTVFDECSSAEPLAKRMPSHAWLTLSNYCNLSCRHCRRTYGRASGDTLSRDIPEELFQRIVVEVLSEVQSVILGGNNNSEITKAVRFPHVVDWLTSASKRPRRISLQTNGCEIADELVEQLVTLDTVFNISVEGGTDETCRRIRGIPLSTLGKRIWKINNLRMHGRSKARIVLSFTAMRSNIDELPLLVEFAERCGVDEVNVMYLLPATSEWNRESLLHVVEHNNKVLAQTERLAEAWNVELMAPPILDIKDGPCLRPWYSISINGQGLARFCCLDGSPVVGDLNKQSLAEVWNSPASQRVRRAVNTDNPPYECGACVLRNLPRMSKKALEKQMM